MQKTLNLKVKFRESFRPFAPSVLREEVGNWFDLEDDSPYMLIVADERGDFGRYIAYNTWLARPLAGSEGIMPRGWSPVSAPRTSRGCGTSRAAACAAT